MLLRRVLIRIGWTDSSSLLTIFNRYCNKLHDLSVTNLRCYEDICGNISILYAVWLWNLLSVELINSLFYQFKMLWKYLWQHSFLYTAWLWNSLFVEYLHWRMIWLALVLEIISTFYLWSLFYQFCYIFFFYVFLDHCCLIDCLVPFMCNLFKS